MEVGASKKRKNFGALVKSGLRPKDELGALFKEGSLALLPVLEGQI